MIFDERVFSSLNSGKNNAVRSSLKKFEGFTSSSGLSIKLPVKGTEHYKVSGSYYKMDPGKFLVVKKGEELQCILDSKEKVDSVCIYLDETILVEALERDALKYNLEELQAENLADRMLSSAYILGKTELDSKLIQVSQMENPSDIDEEDYLEITSLLAKFLFGEAKMMNDVDAQSKSTREEVYKRLRVAKMFIYDNFARDINLDAIAKECLLSKFHLLRCYKDVYKTTPYKTLQSIRIQKATKKLKNGYSIMDTAVSCGYTNRRSFSRAFKSQMGISPSDYAQRMN